MSFYVAVTRDYVSWPNVIWPTDISDKTTVGQYMIKEKTSVSSGCGRVDSAVAYTTIGLGFESSHRQLLLHNYILLTDFRKDKLRKRGQEWPIFKTNETFWPMILLAREWYKKGRLSQVSLVILLANCRFDCYDVGDPTVGQMKLGEIT